MNNSCLLVKPF